jgi:hypothetical protein
MMIIRNALNPMLIVFKLIEGNKIIQLYVDGRNCNFDGLKCNEWAAMHHHHHASLLKSSTKQVVCFGAWELQCN